MRKYDIKNKRNIGIILIISIGIIIMFSLFIRFFILKDKKEYKVEAGSLVFDKDKTIIKLKEDGIIKIKWSKEYYLIYQNKNYELGPSALSYNENNGQIHLYGRYYEITSDEEINITSDETTIKNSAITKFYKLADRKYLVIDKEIKSADGQLSTTDFLMVDLDKVGNGILTNHKINLKTFSATTIVTSNYTFEIASEILTYGSEKIDLKKIIGSSNKYTKKDLVPTENGSSSGGGTGGGQGNTSGTTGGGASSSGDNITNIEDNNSSSGGNSSSSGTIIEEVKKAQKRTTVVATSSTTNKITIDYIVYDPKNEYLKVYMEVKEKGANNIETIILNKNDTVYELGNLSPNKTYELTFKYSYLDENNNEKTETFDNIDVTTKLPSLKIKVTRTRGNEISYLITTDNTYPITHATLRVISSSGVIKEEKIEINGNTTSTVVIPSVEPDEIIELQLVNVESNGNIINGLQASNKFKY